MNNADRIRELVAKMRELTHTQSAQNYDSMKWGDNAVKAISRLCVAVEELVDVSCWADTRASQCLIAKVRGILEGPK